MKKLILFLIMFCSPIFLFGQNSQYKGFYQARFFNLFSEPKVIEVNFEVSDDNLLNGKIKYGNVQKIIVGKVEKNGKFEARTEIKNGVVTIFKGEFPVTKNEGKVSLVERSEQKEKGSKSVSESGINGFMKVVSPPVELKDVGIIDNGKTQLWFQHSNPIFAKEWQDISASAKIINTDGQNLEVLINSKTVDSDREFSIKLPYEKEGQKLRNATELKRAVYRERKYTDGKVSQLNSFMLMNGKTSGQIEIIRETETDIALKITNLTIKKLGSDEFVQIDGYIYAQKSK